MSKKADIDFKVGDCVEYIVREHAALIDAVADDFISEAICSFGDDKPTGIIIGIQNGPSSIVSDSYPLIIRFAGGTFAFAPSEVVKL
jgi:hypothetical protein